MKIFVFVMKHIDHTSREKHIFEVTIRCQAEPEWDAGDGFNDKHKEWVLKHAEWEHNLQEAVRAKLMSMYGDHKWSEYQLHSVKKEKRGNMVNTNHGIPKTNVHFRKMFWMETTICKCTKGEWPQDKHIGYIVNYRKTHYTHEWVLSSKIEDMKITFEETGCKHTFNIEPHAAEQTGQSKQLKQMQPMQPIQPMQPTAMASATSTTPLSRASPKPLQTGASEKAPVPGQTLSEQQRVIAKQKMQNWKQESKDLMPVDLNGPATEVKPAGANQMFRNRIY